MNHQSTEDLSVEHRGRRNVARTLAGVVLAALALALTAPGAAAATDDTPPMSEVYHYTASTVWIDDETTQGLWPVRAAAKAWDEGTNLSVRYGACRKGAACVHVTDEDVTEPVNWAGTTLVNENLLTHKLHGAGSITLNDTWGRSAPAHLRSAVICHEMGHALGLEYHWPNASSGSCIVTAVTPGQSDKPNAQDRAYLNRAYPKRAPGHVPARKHTRSMGWCLHPIRHGFFAGECR